MIVSHARPDLLPLIDLLAKLAHEAILRGEYQASAPLSDSPPSPPDVPKRSSAA